MKQKIKMLLDIVMTILLFVSMSFQFMEQVNHEIFGTILFVTFIFHHLLNWRWYANLGKGKYTGPRILMTVIDFIILIDMFALMFSGMRMSGYVFKWLHLNYSMEIARTLHMTASHGGFLFLGMHVGLHYGMIKNKLNFKDRKIYSILIGLISVYGIYALIKRRFFAYIFGLIHFVLFDFGESVVVFELDLLAIFILMIAIGYNVQKLVISMERGK